ncbi:MAG: hypothetical protein AAFU38_09150 [Bacteroidota bacterium]
MTYSFKRFLPALLFACLVAVGCDSTDPDDPAGGGGNGGGNGNATGTVQVGNDSATDIAGSAYGVLASDGEFGIIIFDGAYELFGTAQVSAYTVLAQDSPSGIPARGTYSIGDSDGYLGGYADIDGNDFLNATFIDAESGTLTVTSSSSDRIVGTYQFTGELFRGQSTQGTTTVSGSFDAPIFREDDFPDEP